MVTIKNLRAPNGGGESPPLRKRLREHAEIKRCASGNDNSGWAANRCHEGVPFMASEGEKEVSVKGGKIIPSRGSALQRIPAGGETSSKTTRNRNHAYYTVRPKGSAKGPKTRLEEKKEQSKRKRKRCLGEATWIDTCTGGT